MKKDINKYWDKYKEIYSFEEIIKVYREKKAIEFLSRYKAKKNIRDWMWLHAWVY